MPGRPAGVRRRPAMPFPIGPPPPPFASMTAASCASCGASVRPDADACDLCGTAVAAERPCPACGHVPPAGSRYCNACGAELRAAEESVPPPPVPQRTTRPRSDAGRRAFAVAAAGVAAVVGLYLVSAWSTSRDAPAEAAVGPAAPVAEATPPLPDSLQAAADGFAEGGTAEGFYEAGRYYLTAAFGASATDPTASVQWARRAVALFEESLAEREDPDVRVALAEAAGFDPATPMRPVQELQAVLAAEPDHVGANFEMGERRFLIGRLDSARVSFERVLALTAPGDPLRREAEAALAAVAQAQAQG